MLVTCSIGCTSNQLLILYMVAINIYNRTRLNRGMGDPLHVVSCYTPSLSPTSEYRSECDRSRTSTPRCCRTRSANTESRRLRPMQPPFRCYNVILLRGLEHLSSYHPLYNRIHLVDLVIFLYQKYRKTMLME